jgi:four helix bundle protein
VKYLINKNKTHMKTYRDLIIWQKSIMLVTKIYSITSSFPKDELFALTSQLKRSAVSIPSNISEGYGRKHRKEFSRFLQISRGSLYELQTQLEIAGNLEFLQQIALQDLLALCNEIERMLNKLISNLSAKTE